MLDDKDHKCHHFLKSFQCELEISDHVLIDTVTRDHLTVTVAPLRKVIFLLRRLTNMRKNLWNLSASTDGKRI